MVWSLTLVPVLVGALLWGAAARIPTSRSRLVLGGGAVAALVTTLALALQAARAQASAVHVIGGGLELQADLAAPANVVAVLVPAVGALVVAYAASHEPLQGLGRLVGLLTVFVGAMQLLVTAADLVTLTVAFELVGGLSWALIGHQWRDPGTSRAAAQAFNATRFGGLGLFLAAGAAFASTGSFAVEALPSATGAHLHVVAGGVLVACAAKSAQGPFAPWLFSAMAGPTPVSALLHSSTMVAAGVHVLARLHPVLEPVPWFGPATIAVGLTTALAGGVVALLQAHVKKLLAASTSAQYGLMFVAVGAGYPAVAVLHLVVHAVFKAHLFLAAGTAIRAVGSGQLGRMRLGSHLGPTAAMAAVSALALAAVPPLGGAWSKESIVAAAGHETAWLAVLTIVAGALSAAYATRFQVLVFGRDRGDHPPVRRLVARPTRVEHGVMSLFAAMSLALGALWLGPVHEVTGRLLGGGLASGPVWELALSVVALVAAAYATWLRDRSHQLGHVGTTGRAARASDWLGLPSMTRRLLVDPGLALARCVVRRPRGQRRGPRGGRHGDVAGRSQRRGRTDLRGGRRRRRRRDTRARACQHRRRGTGCRGGRRRHRMARRPCRRRCASGPDRRGPPPVRRHRGRPGPRGRGRRRREVVVLTLAILAPLVGALALALVRMTEPVARAVAVAVSVVPLVAFLAAWLTFDPASEDLFQLVTEVDWLPTLGVGYRVGVDGIALAVVGVTTVLFTAAVAFPAETRGRARSYYAWFLFLEAVSIGLFVSLDLVLFYVFFDLSLVGMYFLISRWGHEGAERAALQFFLYTLLGSLALLIGIIVLALGPHHLRHARGDRGPAPGRCGARGTGPARTHAGPRHQDPRRPVPHVAPGRARGGPRDGLGDPGRRPAEDGHVRDDPDPVLDDA